MSPILVKPGGALDEEALRRGNSTYLPDRVLPMLPPRLSDDLCSLRPDVVRLTKVCEMKFDKKGKCSTPASRTPSSAARRA